MTHRVQVDRHLDPPRYHVHPLKGSWRSGWPHRPFPETNQLRQSRALAGGGAEQWPALPVAGHGSPQGVGLSAATVLLGVVVRSSEGACAWRRAVARSGQAAAPGSGRSTDGRRKCSIRNCGPKGERACRCKAISGLVVLRRLPWQQLSLRFRL